MTAGAPAVVCIGESMAQIIPQNGGGLERAESFVMTTAGAESNVAIGLARLGTASAWAGYLGADPLGRRIRGDLHDHAVTTDLVRHLDSHCTGVFFKDPDAAGSTVYYYRSTSAATQMDADYVRSVLATNPRIIHVTGITLALSDSCRSSIEFLAERVADRGIALSFDVNYRAQLWPDRETAQRVITAVAARSDVVFVGLDEAQALWGCDTVEDVRATLPGPSRLVIKDGAIECVVFTERDRIAVPALPVDVVEPVGAGDAFAAGWLHGRLVGIDDAACIRLGHLMAGVALISRSDIGSLRVSAERLVRAAVDGDAWASQAGAGDQVTAALSEGESFASF